MTETLAKTNLSFKDVKEIRKVEFGGTIKQYKMN